MSKALVGITLLASGTVWSIVSWYLNKRRNSTIQRLPDKNAVPGYYFVEGLLESNSPVIHDNQRFAKLLVKTTQNVLVNENEEFSYSSNANSTIIQQINHNQILTIDSIDVSDYMESFPLTTIREDVATNSYVYGLPISQGRWRVTGWYNGEKMIRTSTNSAVRYENNILPIQPSMPSIPSILMTIGGSLVLDILVSH